MNAQNYREELEQMRGDLARAGFGSFLIIPLKYEPGEVRRSWLQENCERQPVSTMDINEAVKDNLNSDDGIRILERYYVSGEALERLLFGDAAAEPVRLYACEQDEKPEEAAAQKSRFALFSAYFYLFHTQTAFLCLGITYSDIAVLERICNLGYADSRAVYYYRDGSGLHGFSLDDKLRELCSMAGLECFFQAGSSLFLESYIYTLAVVPRRFHYLESVRSLTFNLHQMLPLGTEMDDDSEGDVHYVYSVKSQELDSYRWGCCVTSQTICYVVADKTLNLEAELLSQAEDGLPVVLLALYEEYSCLRFAQLLVTVDKRKLHMLRRLNRQMLEFRAYGTIHPSHISRWYNVKQIYQYLIETNGIDAAIEDVNNKLNVLAEHQKEVEASTNEAVMGLITLFGIVSILASLLTIIQILQGGGYWTITVAALLLIIAGAALAALWRSRE